VSKFKKLGTVEFNARRQVSLAELLRHAEASVEAGDSYVVEESTDGSGILRLTPIDSWGSVT